MKLSLYINDILIDDINIPLNTKSIYIDQLKDELLAKNEHLLEEKKFEIILENVPSGSTTFKSILEQYNDFEAEENKRKDIKKNFE